MNYRNELISLIKENSSTEGLILTNISSLKFYTTTQISEFVSIIYEPSLCIAIQGSKAVGFGDEMYSYSSEKYLIVSTHIPANVRIEEASKEKPYYSIIINFTLEQIYDVIKELNDDLYRILFEFKNCNGYLLFASSASIVAEPDGCRRNLRY